MTPTASLAVRAIISAQETIPGHSASRRDLMRSIKSNPRRVLFGTPDFSAWLVLVELIRTEASQP